MIPLPHTPAEPGYDPYAPRKFFDASRGSDAATMRQDPNDWLLDRERQAALRLRGPVVAAAHRIGLASSRCYELSQHLASVKSKRLNPPAWATSQDIDSLDQQIRRLESELHDERSGCWRDLQPLLTQSQDHAIEMMRATWLDELVRSIGPTSDSGSTYGVDSRDHSGHYSGATTGGYFRGVGMIETQ
jgi:hypothetical protein